MRLRRIRSTQSCDFVIQSQVISEVPWQIKTRNWHWKQSEKKMHKQPWHSRFEAGDILGSFFYKQLVLIASLRPLFFLFSLLSQLICMLIYRDAYNDPFLAPLHNISRISVEKWMNWAKRMKLVAAFFIAFPNKAHIYQRSPYSNISRHFKYSLAAGHLRTTNN